MKNFSQSNCVTRPSRTTTRGPSRPAGRTREPRPVEVVYHENHGQSGVASWYSAAVMVNVLGSGALNPPDLGRALSVPDVAVHVYGKTENRPGRKLGHVTALGADLDDALRRARTAAEALRL